jgi:hypothetical protein
LGATNAALIPPYRIAGSVIDEITAIIDKGLLDFGTRNGCGLDTVGGRWGNGKQRPRHELGIAAVVAHIAAVKGVAVTGERGRERVVSNGQR